MFNLDQLEAELAGTVFAGRLHFCAVTGSTNTDALAAGRAGAAHGNAYFADEQVAGRGRGNHAWHSAAGQGLYLSVVLRPSVEPVSLPLLPLAIGLAAADAILAVSGLNVDLRWPNDLLIGEKKAGGILVEAQSDAEGKRFAVAGIGINVHQVAFDPGLATAATSLDLEAGRRVSRQALLVALLRAIGRESDRLAEAETRTAIPERVTRASSWVTGRRVEVHGPQACSGVTEGLDEHGFLLVRTANGVVQVQTGGMRKSSS